MSIRSRHTTLGVVRFLEGVRARSAVPPDPGRRSDGPTATDAHRDSSGVRTDRQAEGANQGEVLDTGQSF